MVSRIRLNLPLLPALVAALALLQVIFPSRVWMILFLALGGALAISTAWAFSLKRGLALRRAMRFGWAQVGDNLEERFTLLNSSMFPAVWVEVADRSTLPGYDASTATGVGGEEENDWIIRSVCRRRGIYRLGPTTVRTGDPFGVYEVRFEYSASTTMMVMPPIVPLPPIEVAAGGRSGEGRERLNALERTVAASMVRDYRPGDSLGAVHWRTTARRDALYVKLFDSTPTSDWWVVLDLDRECQSGTEADSTLENSIILAASLADRGLRSRRAVGLAAFGKSLVWLAPGEGEAQRWQVLRELALVGVGDKPLGSLLSGIQSSLGQRASLVIITASTSAEWVRPLISLRRRGLEPTVLLLESVPAEGGFAASHEEMEHLLARQGITHYVLSSDVFDRPEARPGEQGRWEWRVTATGSARALRAPRETGWRALP
ncbi:MAG: DUF58 domain-containing protein [Rudaea sp.]